SCGNGRLDRAGEAPSFASHSVPAIFQVSPSRQTRARKWTVSLSSGLTVLGWSLRQQSAVNALSLCHAILRQPAGNSARLSVFGQLATINAPRALVTV